MSKGYKQTLMEISKELNEIYVTVPLPSKHDEYLSALTDEEKRERQILLNFESLYSAISTMGCYGQHTIKVLESLVTSRRVSLSEIRSICKLTSNNAELENAKYVVLCYMFVTINEAMKSSYMNYKYKDEMPDEIKESVSNLVDSMSEDKRLEKLVAKYMTAYVHNAQLLRFENTDFLFRTTAQSLYSLVYTEDNLLPEDRHEDELTEAGEPQKRSAFLKMTLVQWLKIFPNLIGEVYDQINEHNTLKSLVTFYETQTTTEDMKKHVDTYDRNPILKAMNCEPWELPKNIDKWLGMDMEHDSSSIMSLCNSILMYGPYGKKDYFISIIESYTEIADHLFRIKKIAPQNIELEDTMNAELTSLKRKNYQYLSLCYHLLHHNGSTLNSLKFHANSMYELLGSPIRSDTPHATPAYELSDEDERRILNSIQILTNSMLTSGHGLKCK